MQTLKALKTMAVSAILGAGVIGGGTADATTLSFGNFVSSNGADKLSPIITVSDDPVGSFLVSVTHAGTSDGHLNLIAFDIGAVTFVSSDVTNVKNDATALPLQTPCTNTGNTQASAGKYCFGTSVPVGGNSNNLNGTPGIATFGAAVDVVLGFYNNDSIADNGSTLTFNLSDKGGTLTLADFVAVGLRYQSSNNNAQSDKLIGTPVPPSVVPLPAAGLLLIAGLGGLGVLGRRRRKAA